MAVWEQLRDELDLWRSSGRCAEFWWRDDDARAVTSALRRVLAISADRDVPIALAVIPRDVADELSSHVADKVQAWVLLHGWAHDNHAPADERQSEYGLHRPLAAMIAELARGVDRLNAFARFLPVLVAPWNRIDPHVVVHLPKAGVRGLSVFGPRPERMAAPGITLANVHIDIVDWQGSRGFVGSERALDQILGHLQRKRQGTADSSEPTGLMTHHGFHDEECWSFIETFLDHSQAHPAVRWLNAQEVFG